MRVGIFNLLSTGHLETNYHVIFAWYNFAAWCSAVIIAVNIVQEYSQSDFREKAKILFRYLVKHKEVS